MNEPLHIIDQKNEKKWLRSGSLSVHNAVGDPEGPAGLVAVDLLEEVELFVQGEAVAVDEEGNDVSLMAAV